MSFQEEKRAGIKRYMLLKIAEDDERFVQKTAENFQISATSVKRYLKECQDGSILQEDKDTHCGYRLIALRKHWNYENDGSLLEDRIYQEDIFPQLESISENGQRVWAYAFMEIMNNAIEHSRGSKIRCSLVQNYLYTEISVTDDGVGIFRNVQEYLQERLSYPVSYQDVITELHKGKLTTSSQAHSGEGIFFSSKMLDSFAIWSDNTIFSVGAGVREQLVQSHLAAYYTHIKKIGTMVVMRLENHTKRVPKEVFDMYASVDEGFIKTCLPMRELCPFGEPIARSQARRVTQRLEEFSEIILDFEGVDFMGQGFADEIFRVFQDRNPQVVLTPVHANETVLGMIRHVQRNRPSQAL